MSVQHYLKMIRHASVAQRCHATAALAHIYLHSDLESDERSATEEVLTLLLDDPSPKVRLALAEAFSTSARAPLHIVACLARDQGEIAAYMLGRSVLLSDGDLVDCAVTGGGEAQRVIAARARVSISVSAAIIEIGETVAVLELLANAQARISPVSFRRLVERLGHVAEIRAVLADDSRLPADCRHALAVRTAEALCRMDIVHMLLGAGRAQRVVREACIRASISLVATTPAADYPALIEHLLLRGDITTAFVIRVVAAGEIDFFCAVLVALSGYRHKRVRAILVDGRPAGLGALFSAAGLPETTHKPLSFAVRQWHDSAGGGLKLQLQDVIQSMIEHIADDAGRLQAMPTAANDDMLSLLKGIHRDAIRDAARHRAAAIAVA
ncbi:MAG: DUF2336 domain-containing protein [Phyllobacterium sp.]